MAENVEQLIGFGVIYKCTQVNSTNVIKSMTT